MSFPADVLLADPSFFLHGIDFRNGCVTFLRTDRDRLESAAFLDGRVPLTDEPALVVDIEALLNRPRAHSAPDRVIAHMSFCGSTLLARLLDQPGEVMSYKEPQVFIDLSDAIAGSFGREAAAMATGPLLEIVRAKFRRGFTNTERGVVKPSNWVNPALHRLVTYDTRHLLIEIGPRAFLTAVLRGGRERIAFTLRATAHLQRAFPDTSLLMREAVTGEAPMVDALRLSLMALELQHRVFDQLDPQRDRRITFDDIRERPEAAIRRAGILLDLPVDAALSKAAERRRRNAKADTAYDPAMRSIEDRETERHHGNAIDRALDWGIARLPAIAAMA